MYLLFGRFWVDAAQRRRTAYGLTTRRLIIVSGLLRTTITSLPLGGLDQIRVIEGRDGRGDIVFGAPSIFDAFMVPGWPGASGWPGMGEMRAPRFERVSDVHELAALIDEARDVAR